MDPKANLNEQRELAREIMADVQNGEFGMVPEKAERLADLVLGLDEWRQKGGFDPYEAEPGDPRTDFGTDAGSDAWLTAPLRPTGQSCVTPEPDDWGDAGDDPRGNPFYAPGDLERDRQIWPVRHPDA